MTLSDEDRRRIDEEEYRKLSRERLERTERIEAEIRTTGDQHIAPPAQAPQEIQGTTVAVNPLVISAASGFISASVVVSAIATGGISLIPIACVAGIYGVVKLASRSKVK